MYGSQNCPKNVTCPKNASNCFATLSHVYHMYHVPGVSYRTSVCVSNLPQKCDQQDKRLCLMCIIRIMYHMYHI